jgi:hypothetical protein
MLDPIPVFPGVSHSFGRGLSTLLMTERSDEGKPKSRFHFPKEVRERLHCLDLDCHDGHVFLHSPNKGTNREISPQESDTLSSLLEADH